jgi:drug/metabolite transporter (DMT)-like permease
MGVLVSVIGLACVIYADAAGRDVDGESNWRGNCLSLGAAFLYASCNCLEEKVLSDSRSSTFEMLGMLGVWGVVISLSQAFTFEQPLQVQITSGVVTYWSGYAACMVSFYFLLSYFMSKWDASLFNLSILTASVYAALIDWGSFKLGYWLYGLGFALTLTGCILYHSSSSRSVALPK